MQNWTLEMFRTFTGIFLFCNIVANAAQAPRLTEFSHKFVGKDRVVIARKQGVDGSCWYKGTLPVSGLQTIKSSQDIFPLLRSIPKLNEHEIKMTPFSIALSRNRAWQSSMGDSETGVSLMGLEIKKGLCVLLLAEQTSNLFKEMPPCALVSAKKTKGELGLQVTTQRLSGSKDASTLPTDVFWDLVFGLEDAIKEVGSTPKKTATLKPGQKTSSRDEKFQNTVCARLSF